MRRLFLLVALFSAAAALAAEEPFPGTLLLTNRGDLSAQMVAGIDAWLMRETSRVPTNRGRLWQRDVSSREAYEKSIAPNREHLRRLIGVVDERAPARGFEAFNGSASNAAQIIVTKVRWAVFPDVWAEGLLLDSSSRKSGDPVRCVIALPDAGQTPEMLAGLQPGAAEESQFARHLAASGFRVLIPVLLSRSDEFSGNEKIKRFTNQPHREWIYRQSYELGRHVIGYEVQAVLAAVDCFKANGAAKVGVAGYGEGGLLALYAAAIDTRVDAALVSGYFGAREQLWAEPIYRNVFGLLKEFGDAEIATLIAPRKLIVEHSKAPLVNGPPASRGGRSGAAPGKITTPEFNAIEGEVERANELTGKLPGAPFVEFAHGAEGMAVVFGSPEALSHLSRAMGGPRDVSIAEGAAWSGDSKEFFDPAETQRAVVRQWERYTRDVFMSAERERDTRFWSQLKNTNAFLAMCQTNREFFWRDVIGKIDAPKLPPQPRTRKIYDEAKWTGYEVTLDVLPDVFAWGVLLVPKDLKPGERRPVVVCQHGLEGVPADTIVADTNAQGWKYYKAFAAKLAERGFIAFSPHNPYRGGEKFRVLQRKANPLGLSLFSFIIAQHEVETDWLASLPFVDPQRIAFYGLSYGGKTAMRVPPVVERYCLSICSADFNEWVLKKVSLDAPFSYMFTGEYEMPEWDLGHTFNYSEMAALIAPRPFMVERGHADGVSVDSWVAYEYAKVRRMYNVLGLGDRTEIEFFNGPHTINGVGTFQFLHRHLNWPEPK
jgi:dienelactone hydrolase